MKKTSSTSTESTAPWASARKLYDQALEIADTGRPPEQTSIRELTESIQSLMASMLLELKQSTSGIITPEAISQFELTVSKRSVATQTNVDFLSVGDIRLINERFVHGNYRPLPVLLVEQDFETDQWLVVPFGGNSIAMREGEWETQLNEPLLDVLCFWNARRLQGAVLEDSLLVERLTDEELRHFTALNEAWSSGTAWAVEDQMRSVLPSSPTLDDDSSTTEREIELMRGLTLVHAFRPSGPSGAAALAASSEVGLAPHAECYRLAGFGRELHLRSGSDGFADIELGDCRVAHAAPLHAPKLITGVGTEYPLNEGTHLRVPMKELARGFWVSVGNYGWATLVAAAS